MFCEKCGTKQNGGEKFCPNCGTPFTEVAKTASKELAFPRAEKKGSSVLLKVAAAIVVLCAIFYYATKEDNSDNSTNHYGSESIQNDYSNKSQSSRFEANFRSGMDVRTFLCNHVFSDGSVTLTFFNGANEMRANGRQMSVSMEIRSFSYNQAELYFHGAYSNSRFVLAANGGEAALMDMNDYSIYDAIR